MLFRCFVNVSSPTRGLAKDLHHDVAGEGSTLRSQVQTDMCEPQEGQSLQANKCGKRRMDIVFEPAASGCRALGRISARLSFVVPSDKR